MKTITKKIVMILALLLMVLACDEDDSMITPDDAPQMEEEATDNEDENEEETEDEEETDTEGIDPNLLTQSLKFRNMQLKQGTIPINTNSPYYQTPGFQISQDTIFWVAGIINRVRIRKPDGFGPFTGSFSAKVPGADSYVDAEFEREKENDTIVFWDVDFDPPIDWNLPVSFDLDITLKDDDTGEAIGEFTLPVVIEEPTSSSGNCGSLYAEGLWNWMETSVNGQYQSAPLDMFRQEAVITGCCGGSPPISYTAGCNTQGPDAIDIEYTNSYSISFDYFRLLLNDNTIVGQHLEVTSNLDPLSVDFCALNAPLSDASKWNTFQAEVYEFNPSNCSFRLQNFDGDSEFVGGIEFPLPIFMGSGDFVEYKLISPHFIKETRSGDGLLERIYIRADVDVPGTVTTEPFWFEITYNED